MAGPARGIPAILIGGFFVFISFMMARDRIGELRRGLDSADWPAVQGEVLRSHVERRGGSRRTGNRSRLVLEYRYEVAGTVYEGDRVAFTVVRVGRVPDTYPKGDTVTVHHDPADPTVSVLEPGVRVGAAAASLAPFLFFGMLGLALTGWGIRAATT